MKKIFGLVAVSVMVLACSNEDQNARLEVRLTDAPGDYEEVNIDIQGIEIHSETGNQTTGWKSLDVEEGVYDLLKLADGRDTLISSMELPPGRISQIRLILGDDNSVTIEGASIDLIAPSANHSGLKLNLHAELTEGITYKILLDFDAARSIVRAGNGSYSLKPVIRSISEPEDGAIKGIASPIDAAPAVFAISGIDTVATAYADASGKFLLQGVPVGVYTVTFDPKEGFAEHQITNVSVTLGNVTDLGTVNLE